ncbi:hypothetical protein VPH35_122370 [Triticum aestivum]
MNRGFSPPGSKFFKEVLQFFKLHLQDIGPKSISNICNFQVLYEVYLQEEPTVELFREYFYLNRQNECTNGLSLELGGISIQRRQGDVFPFIVLPSHPKDWNQTWSYCQDISPANEKPLPGYRPERLDSKFAFPDKLTAAERKKLIPSIKRINALLGNGLTGVDLTRCWISWRVIPLSRRSKLMYEYGGGPDDSLRHSSVQLTKEDIVSMSSLLVNGKYKDCSIVGLNSFYKLNPVPEARSDFWKVKYDHEAAKKARATAINAKKTTRGSKKKKKSTAEDWMKLDDSSESEEVSRSPGNSSQTQFPAFKTAPGGQAKSKKAKVTKPAEDPRVLAPELARPPSPPSIETPEDLPVNAEANPPEPSVDDTIINPSTTEPSSSANPPSPSAQDVLITGSRFVELGNPTMLARHTTKQEALERQKVCFDVAHYDHLNANDILSGYLSHVHSSRNSEIEMVKQLQLKYENALSELSSQLTDAKTRLAGQEAEIKSGPRSKNLSQDHVIKLKAVYTLMEQLYIGAQRALAAISPANQGPNHLNDVLKKLSILPARFQEVKRSCARAGALTTLSRSKAWVPDPDPADVARGYPTVKEDGSPFEQDDFMACVRGVRPQATILGDETNIDKYQPGFDVENKKMETPSYKVTDLIPLVHENTFAPEVDPAGLIDEEAEFVAVNGFDWSKPSF